MASAPPPSAVTVPVECEPSPHSIVAVMSHPPPPVHGGASGLASVTVASWVAGRLNPEPAALTAALSHVAVSGASVTVTVPVTGAPHALGLGVTVNVKGLAAASV